MLEILHDIALRKAAAAWRTALALLFVCVFVAAPAPAAGTGTGSGASVDAAVQRLKNLLAGGDATPGALRRAKADLAAAYAAHPDGEEGARAAFSLARAQEEIAARSGSAADWRRAAEGYGAFLWHFPHDMFVTEALYCRGRIFFEHLNDPDAASKSLRTLLTRHPGSVYAGRAQSLLRKVQAAAPDSAPAAPAAERPPAPDGRPTLFAVHVGNRAGRARITFDLDAAAAYKYRRLSDTRMYIDIAGANVGPAVRREERPAGGLLTRIRVAERRAGGGFVRVVLDFTSLRNVALKTFKSPFRIRVEARGPADAAASDADDAAASAPPDEPAPVPAAGSGRRRLPPDLVEQLGLSVHTIMLDPGHGGKDPGARANGLNEKDVNLRMARTLGRELRRRGFRVLFTRTRDVFVPLPDRTAAANGKKADLFISLHCNAFSDPSKSGLEVYSLNLAKTRDEARVAARENSVSGRKISDLQMILTDLMLTSKIKESVQLARDVQKDAVSAVRTRWSVRNNGNRAAPFYVLMGAKMPALLIEVGYLTNRAEAAHLESDAYLSAAARGIADGVEAYRTDIERFAATRTAEPHHGHRHPRRRRPRS